jgi:hypothetical protein
MQFSSTPWWTTDEYKRATALPSTNLSGFAGPLGPALVQVFDDERTQPGWGEKQFMGNYRQRLFHARRAVVRYDKSDIPFAIVMRSLRMVVIDIDGKNGGIEHAKQLLLPPTLAETSRSGNGYHLFYVVDDEWDAQLGFAKFADRIGLVTGVDVRGTGCVYHYSPQRWNERVPVWLPDHVSDRLLARKHEIEQTMSGIKAVLDSDDPEEILLMQDTIQSRLTAPIPAGRRNNTLFAIGAEMAKAQVPSWEEQLYNRGIELGLSDDEMTKLITNVRRYG